MSTDQALRLGEDTPAQNAAGLSTTVNLPGRAADEHRYQ